MDRLAAAGAFVISLDSVVNVALPAIAADFGVPVEGIRGVIVWYVLTYAVMSFVGGVVADRAGHVRIFRAGLAVSVAAFVVGAAAPQFGVLLGARALQGLGAGFVYGTAPGILMSQAVSERHGRALGLLNGAIGLGLAAGPVLGGVLVEVFGWRAVFLARVPLTVLVLLWAWWSSAAAPRARGAPGPIGAARFAGRVLGAGALAFLANAGIFAVWLLAPFYLLGLRRLSAPVAGGLFMLTPLGTATAAPAGGRLADRIGPRLPVIAGLATEAVGLMLLSRCGAATPLIWLGIALLVAGLGLGLFQASNMTALMAAAGATRPGAAGGFAFLARTLGTVVGVLTCAEVFARRRAAVGLAGAFSDAFLMAGAAVALAALLGAADRSWRHAR